jgi:hypothetical protein
MDEFAMRGHRTMVVSPRYAAYQKAHKVGSTTIWLDGRNHEVKFFHLYQDLGGGNGTDYIFVGHDCFMREHFYCDPHNGQEYLDIVKVLFTVVRITIEILTTCSAALEAPLVWNIHGHTYGQDRHPETESCCCIESVKETKPKEADLYLRYP